MSEPPLPTDLCMRRQPRQQRSQETVTRIEQATLALLQEQGFLAINTNAIAARAGVGIKSLYHLFPNKEAIICRLAMDWLAAVCAAQEVIRQEASSWPQTLQLLDQALDELDTRFVGYGALWQAMDLVPALHELECEHERGQVAFWSERLRHFGCRWPEPELTALVRYFYRTADVVKQCAKEQGREGPQMWLLHRQWLEQLVAAAIAEPDPARVWQAMPGLMVKAAD
ncbi:TetR/AcrR family transcriptional regulator [Aeromonas salmonicida]|nr:TetR/AcrR family transcriptional regulator [Aeromonas salmonicida]MDR6994640.1 AcrR family transcriptional regulator [Aeromonas salmonicida]HEH9411929.1 TetR/AcrR family transcriptional regulator [Aeromonas salmonicida]HEH9420747.1 TetR/AcrR family transcriptional regulator [Aeromonas salmonicida]HEH9433996.1 TetR/AcrR family transcriptional regulator [Aeromonas salmonicida]